MRANTLPLPFALGRKLAAALVGVAALAGLTWGLVIAGGDSGVATQAVTYEVSITNLTRGQPLSPIFLATHTKGVEPLYTLGQPASAALAAMAEDADAAGLMAAWNPATNEQVGSAQFVTSDSGPILPGKTVTATITVQGKARYLSLAGMLVNTNDAFIGANGVELYNRRMTLVAYDAGSEANSENCAYIPGPACGNHVHDDTAAAEGYVHVHAGVHGGGGLDPAQHDWRNPVAVVAIRRLPSPPACTDGDRALNVGFYAFFEPVSYSADENPAAAGFHIHRGYEADLLTALEALDGAGLSFSRRGIDVWDGIWLRSAGPQYDIIGGGITILDSRTRDATGRPVVAFTSGHIAFRQSLLVRAADAERLATHDDLTSDVRVGALAGTTGEFRLLELTGLVDANGVLAVGTRIETPQGTVVADGSAAYVITAAGESPNLAGRRHLQPPMEAMPQVVYLGDVAGETELLAALGAGTIDALARGEIGNRDAAHVAGGVFVVTALDDAVEFGGFTLAVSDAALAACLDEKINWLTDNRRIGYGEWVADPSVFLKRAELWNRGG